jgi:hypothetical protein
MESIAWSWRKERLTFQLLGGIDGPKVKVETMVLITLYDWFLQTLGGVPLYIFGIYTYFHRMVTLVFEEKMIRVGSLSSYQKKHLILEHISIIGSHFEELFSFLPLLSLTSDLFLSSAFILQPLTERKFDLKMVTTIVFTQFSRLSLLFLLIVMVSRNNDRMSTAAENVIETICHKDNVSCRDIWLMLEIRKISQWKSTVFFMTHLDRPLIPGFTGALLSFSVLFIQIAKEID